MTNYTKNEALKAWRRFATLTFLGEYLPKHIGESFTCRELRAICPDISSNIASQWMTSKSWAFGVVITSKKETITYDPPLEIWPYWRKDPCFISHTEVKRYHIERKIGWQPVEED